ncbi:hypothetical protein C7E12_20015 [Stenotrophomonas maltophilia]|nr:hypothetical protein C7E12_20015 [Stenotrophomonas maltophilia]
MISLRNFALRRGERLLLSNVDLTLHAGYRVGVVGRKYSLTLGIASQEQCSPAHSIRLYGPLPR